jgi:hypothetical protein
MTLAIREAVIHHRALVAFTECMQAENENMVGMWEENVRCWELDPLTVPCPYDIPEESKLLCDQLTSLRLTHLTFNTRSDMG